MSNFQQYHGQIKLHLIRWWWLWKKRLKSDGHQFHQYQQNKQAPLISTHWTSLHYLDSNQSLLSYSLTLCCCWWRSSKYQCYCLYLTRARTQKVSLKKSIHYTTHAIYYTTLPLHHPCCLFWKIFLNQGQYKIQNTIVDYFLLSINKVLSIIWSFKHDCKYNLNIIQIKQMT
jgi:hypothetical protein